MGNFTRFVPAPGRLPIRAKKTRNWKEHSSSLIDSYRSVKISPGAPGFRIVRPYLIRVHLRHPRFFVLFVS